MRVLSSFRDSSRTVAAAAIPSGRTPIASDREIRILELLSGEFDWPLQCHLHRQRLVFSEHDNAARQNDTVSAEQARHATPRPQPPRKIKYQALSYTWGSWDDAHAITVDGAGVKITRNLWEALRCLRRRYRVRFLWVDQICIDQSDINERNHQVRLMKQVYQQAATVLIWLGDWSADPECREHLKDFQRVVGVFDRAKQKYLHAAAPDAPVQDGKEPSMKPQRLPWYTRGWVVQEAVLATNDPIICVSRWEVSAERFLASARSTSPLTLGLRSILGYRKLPEESRTLLRFTSILFETNVTEPRDKIYSLLGLITPEESKLITPDYSAALSEVYKQATYASIVANENLGILSLVLDQRSDVRNLPSWAVDFGLDSIRKRSRRNIRTRWSAGDTSQARDLRRLTAKRDLDHFSHLPRIWCPQQQSRRPTVSMDITKGTLRVLGLKFDDIAHSIALDDLVGIESTAYGALQVPRPRKIKSAASRPLEGMTPKRWLAALKAGQYIAIPTSTNNNDSNDNTHNSSTTMPKAFHHWLKTYLQIMPDSQFKTLASPQPWMNYFLTTTGDHHHAQCLVSRHRFLGLGPVRAREGDVLALLYGAPAPAILRKFEEMKEGVEEEGMWMFVGFAYVHGIMAHELMDTPELQFEEMTFVLR